MTASVGDLVEFVRDRRVAVVTGAGCSTRSGIPDYRSGGTARRARQPLQYREYVGSAEARARYWSRSAVGWLRVAGAQPNAAHHALAELETRGTVVGLITQNVDRLHSRAGHRQVIELHGSVAEVRCLSCGEISPRAEMQERLLALNPDFAPDVARVGPDGDADIASDTPFAVPACRTCGGVLKPDVVFFGESVPKERTAAAYAVLDRADLLLVVGSSLTVYSGFRFVRAARERRQPVAIVNLEATRGDELCDVRLFTEAGETLSALANLL